MSTKIASLAVEFTAENAKLKTALNDVKKDVKQTADQMGELKKGAAGVFEQFTGVQLATIGLTAGLTTLAAGLRYTIDAAAESEAVNAKLTAVIKATGGAAGFTADEIDRMSTAWMRQSGVDDEVVKSAAAVMLTFREITKDVFPAAMQAALDMSAVMGQDLQTSVLQIGKALQDPISGLTALRRVGVMFNDEQERMIKLMVESGDKMGAQKLILNELSREFGGAAEAAGGTFAGQLKILKGEVNNLAEAIGGKLLPPLTTAVTALSTLLSWNEKVSTATNEHKKAVAKSSETYGDYIKELDRVAQLNGLHVTQEGELIQIIERKGETITLVKDKAYAMSEAEFEAAKRSAESASRAQAGWLDVGATLDENVNKYNKLADKKVNIDVTVRWWGVDPDAVGQFSGGGGGKQMEASGANFTVGPGYGYAKAAGGMSFNVPPGYPRDSMLIGVQTGEHVEITPPGDKYKTKDGITVNINGATINKDLDIKILARQVANEIQRRM